MIPRDLVLVGNFAWLEPLRLDHAADLHEAVGNEPLTYLNLWKPTEHPDEMAQTITRVLSNPDLIPFAVIDAESGRAVGSTSFMDLRPADRSVEIGNTWLGEAAQGTRVNPQMKLLMLAYAFETAGCNRVQLKTDARNLRSRAAIAKLGATFEGILRKHLVCRDGFVRDTAMFSIIAEEWPAVRDRLQSRLTIP